MAKKSKSSRNCIIIGNWKMYKTIAETLQCIESLNKELPSQQEAVQFYLAVPFTAIHAAAQKRDDTRLVIGAQNMNDVEEGAFTGEVAAAMLKEAGARFVLLGHSERRKLFSESNAFINRKVKKAIATGLQPVLCIGETYEEREAGMTQQILASQLRECLADITAAMIDQLIIAYEPVWAIGTGKAATPEIVAEVHAAIRKELAQLFGAEAEKVPVLYGGSVTAQNTAAYLQEKEIDGLLVGSASLYPESFAKICQVSHNERGLMQERI